MAKRDRQLQKILWHVQDHFHPDAERIVEAALDRFRPELVNTHNLQGIGYNLLRAVGRHGVPCVQTLHDFGFLCIAMNMFRGGQECVYRHLSCQGSAALKRRFFLDIEALAFVAPSVALLNRYRPYLPPHREACAIPLALQFPALTNEAHQRSDRLRVLFVGQLEPWKGIDFLLSAIASLSQPERLKLQIVGGGSLLDTLTEKYRAAEWVSFVGKVPAATVSRFMQESDILAVPSIWFENAPIVISEAIHHGLPVLASDVGGLPEMVERGTNGDLLPPGHGPSWTTALERLLRCPEVLATWKLGAATTRDRFSADTLGNRTVELFSRMITGRHTQELVAEETSQ
jgi:glycosyltransferase involved in cell wall biosynthesis